MNVIEIEEEKQANFISFLSHEFKLKTIFAIDFSEDEKVQQTKQEDLEFIKIL